MYISGDWQQMMRAYTTYTHGGSNYSENEESSKRLLLRHNDSNLISTSQKVLCFPNKAFKLVSRYYVYYVLRLLALLFTVKKPPEKSVNSYFFLCFFLLVCFPTVKKIHVEIFSLNELISPTFECILMHLPVHSIWIKFVFLTPLFLIRFLPICTQKVWVRFKPITLMLIHF